MISFKYPGIHAYAARTALLSVILLCHIYINAQTVPTRRYSSRDGLTADRITVITQDEKGYMWMGSLFGLCKYDGKKFTTIQLPASQKNKTVSSLLAVNNKLYAGFLFGGGLMEYDNGRINTFTVEDPNAVTRDISGLFAAHNGIFIINPYNQIYSFVDGKFRLLLRLDSTYEFSAIRSIVDDDNGNTWIGTNRGMLIYKQGKLITVLKDHVIAYARKTKKGILIGSSYKQNKLVQLMTVDKGGDSASTILWQSPDLVFLPYHSYKPGSFWGMDLNKGLLNITETGHVEFRASKLNVQTEIKYLFSDRENNLWLASDPGVLVIANVPVISYMWNELALGGADILQTDSNSFYSTNSIHLYHIGNNQVTKLPDFRGEKEQDNFGVLFNGTDGSIWASGWNQGLWKLKYNGTRLISKNYYSRYRGRILKVNCSARDNQGNIWVGGTNGIFHISNGMINDHFDVGHGVNMPAFVTALAVDETRQIIWAGDNAAGIFKISYRQLADKFQYEVIDHFDANDGLEDSYVRSLLLDSRKNLWIGTRLGGIYLMNESDEKAHRVQSMSHKAGITCTRVTDITEDKGKSIWFATCDGLLRYSLLHNSWQKYGVSNGLLGAEIFSVIVDEYNQEVLSTSGEGVTSISTVAGQENVVSPQVNITNISIQGLEDSTALLGNKEIKLTSRENSISFVYAAASYTDEKRIRYKYKLEGYDKEWSAPVETNNVNYLSLPFGHYTFKVLAWNGQAWSEQPATFSFYITRPFYKSPLFALMIVTVLMTLVYAVRTYRLNQKLKLEKLRLNIARDLHDDIGSALGSINLLSENANRNLATNRRVDEVAGVFQKIGYSAQTVLDSMDDIIWAINPEKDSLTDLLIRMREFAIPLLETSNIKLDLDMQASEDMKPSMELKRNLYLIFKEAITNIVRHAESTYVSIYLRFHPKTFEMKIHDNGKGFNTDNPGMRNGVKNMQKRAAMSGAELSIVSGEGIGTTISLQGALV